MPSKSKSIWRDPSAQHFQVVHRSQRDPLINDSSVGQHVLKAVTPRHSLSSSSSSSSKGNTLTDLEQELAKQGVKERENVGQASLYGVYYDDTQYDYMQHLRPIGGNYHSQRGGKDEELDTTAILLEAPKGKNQKNKDKGKGKGKDGEEEGEVGQKQDEEEMQGFKLKKQSEKRAIDLPPQVLPNKEELSLEQSRRNQLNIDPQLKGLQPDMDPHLRQVLEALDDEAFDFEKARKNLSKSKIHQKSLRDRGMGGEEGGNQESIQQTQTEQAAAEDKQEEQGEGDDGDEIDFDDFLAGIIKEGELKPEDQEPEWKSLPPAGEESIWLDPEERALLFKSKDRKSFPSSSSFHDDDQDSKTEIGVGVVQDENIPDIKPDESLIDDDGISLSARISLFKKAQKLESQFQSEKQGHQTSSKVPASRMAPSVAGSQTSIFSETKKKARPGVKARLGASSMAGSQDGDGASAWSMSSSAMFRNEGLKGLDDRFDRLEQLYEEEDEEEEEEEDNFPPDQEDETPPPPSREDFDSILDDFLDKYELLGGKMKPLLGDKNSTPVEKLSLLRKELGEARIGGKEWKIGEGEKYVRKYHEQKEQDQSESESESEDETPLPMPRMIGENREKWDVETVLSTRTNAENHPRILPLGSSIAGGSTTSNRPVSIAASSYLASSIAGSKLTSSGLEKMPKVKVDPRTGLTKIVGWEKGQKRREKRDGESVAGQEKERADEEKNEEEDDEDEYDSDVTEGPRNVTITRPRNEDKEEKKARKAAAKEEKQARRQAKSNLKAAFAQERKRQNQSEIQRTRDGGAADIGRNGIKMRGGATAIKLN